MRTLYDILGIAPTSTQPEIRRAYRRAAMRWHPDRHAHHVDDATRRFKEIGDAYRVLSNAARRAHYDDSLHASRERVRESGRVERDPRERIGQDDSIATILAACAWRALHGLDRVVDAGLFRLRKAASRARRRGRPSGRAIGTMVIAVAILVLILSLPHHPAPTRAAAVTVEDEVPSPASAVVPGRTRRGDAMAEVFPGYDATSRSARFMLGALPPSPVYDPLRPLEGHTMTARFVLREDLGTAYRMYYFGISTTPPDDACDACAAFFARFMTRRQANGETVVVPMQLVFMPERMAKPPD